MAMSEEIRKMKLASARKKVTSTQILSEGKTTARVNNTSETHPTGWAPNPEEERKETTVAVRHRLLMAASHHAM
ncbi:hypothetical protein P7K49_017255 [Saguinus oedipus]|uniref:Uncharacterized protein n=1 Tax=Saguinus oedipus TaxID=9490 RepID=A0ABQ9V1Y6_SAGOE|nr:hypothetical protein P7K49_017255 [Saguinus oedipus]